MTEISYEMDDSFKQKLEAAKLEKEKAASEEKSPQGTVPEIAQDVLDEALIPELSRDFFTIPFDDRDNVVVQIKPLKYKYTTRIASLLYPVFQDMAYEADNDRQLQGLVEVLKHSDALCDIVAVLAQNDGKNLTPEDIGESLIGIDQMIDIVIGYAQKSKTIEKAVRDFFIPVVKRLKGVESGLQDILSKVETAVETQKASSTTTV